MNDGRTGEPYGPMRGPDGVHSSVLVYDAAPPAGPGALPARRIELLPNCSLTVPAALLFFGSIALASLTFAMYFVVQGLWPVLPFAGLELGVLGWALWASMRRRHWTQTIEVDDRNVSITLRGPKGESTIVFSRHWAGVKLRAPRGWHPSRLFVESHGRACEVGGFLTEDDRRALYRRLGEMIGRPAESPPLRAEIEREALPARGGDGGVATRSFEE